MVLNFFPHIAPEAVEIETSVSSMSILEENMELFIYVRHSRNININVIFK